MTANKIAVWKKYIPLIRELVKRDLKVKYRRSFLGYVWSLLNPLLMMIVMSAVFSFIFRFDIPNYPLYLITGQTLWTFFNESTNIAMYSIIQNAALLKKIYIPKFIFPISRVISSFVTMMFSLIAILIVMVFTGVKVTWAILLFPIPLCFLFIFCVGIGMILSSLSVYFRDITHLYSVVCLAWMYATPIFYPINQLSVWMQNLMKLNPMYHFINCFRQIVLYGNVPGYNTFFGCIASSLVVLIIGLFVFNKLQKNFVSQI
ncbi:MAG: ABC transporter permease [Anaerorhabdus sp.]|uniref:ABC transporter permease n=1 Tax=Anaerorhabdus sp. TaxID=1872524 RepID=UPI002FC90D2A